MGVWLKNTVPEFKRFIKTHTHTGCTGASQPVGTAGRVYLMYFEIEIAQTIDAICIFNMATVAGTVRVGIYAAGAQDTPIGGSVLVESGDVALTGTSAPQIISLTKTSLPPGQYWAAVEFSDITHTYTKISSTGTSLFWSSWYDRAGGYGALTTPCPALGSNNSSNGVQVTIRVSS